MRMGMAQVPRESLVWMDSLVRATPKDMPIVYITHNPVEKSLSNWDHVYDILKQGNLVLTMGGHWHSNNFKTYDGIPAVIGRSTLASTPKFGGAGYNIVRIDTRTGDVAIYNRQASGTTAEKPWCTFNLFTTADRSVPQSRPDYSINQQYPNVEVVWQFQDKADIGRRFCHRRTPDLLCNGSRRDQGGGGQERKTRVGIPYRRTHLFLPVLCRRPCGLCLDRWQCLLPGCQERKGTLAYRTEKGHRSLSGWCIDVVYNR